MKKTKLIVSHPTGNANVRALTYSLAENGLLHQFYTCIAFFESSYFYKFIKLKPLKEFTKRTFPNNIRTLTSHRPAKELLRLILKKMNYSKYTKHETGPFCIDSVYKDLDRYVAGKLIDETIVYSFEDGALENFKKAKSKGIKCLYELPIGYWRAMRDLLDKERILNPEWAITMETFKDSKIKLQRKDEEIELSDHIFVASSFTKKTLEYYSGKLPSISVVPYGFPPVFEKRKYQAINGRKLKLLFVGGLSQRKGISYLFKAMEVLADKVELTIVGQEPVKDCKILYQNLENHRWISALSHSEILKTMRNNDILIFPSLFEGFGLVITEAMSQGTPVITTNRTCGADLIENDIDGWIVPAGSSDAIVDRVNKILNDPSCLERVGKMAMRKAKTRPWNVYGEEMVDAIGNYLNDKIENH